MILREQKKKFNKTLFSWHEKNYRDMAWRNTRNPYRILVSEIMLQQTQVDRVRTKYVEFLKKFPNIPSLAEASLGDILRVWSGLGYNRRAKYLHECAKQIVLVHGGKFPRDIPTLMTLSGIGISTSAAVAAFAFDADEPMIDTNIRRVLCRVFFKKNVPTDKELYVFAKELIPEGRGRGWNYAMLDLGATLCTARSHSPACPMVGMHGNVGDFVYKKPQKKFARSDRYYRGRILARLIEGGISRRKLRVELGLSVVHFNVIIKKLHKEHLIRIRPTTLSLP